METSQPADAAVFTDGGREEEAAACRKAVGRAFITCPRVKAMKQALAALGKDSIPPTFRKVLGEIGTNE